MHRSILLFACLSLYTAAFTQQYPLVQYTPKDGLINSRVRKAFQDSRGRIYFLTYGGLSVYDGIRFKNYTTENGLASDLVNDIIETGKDTLLIAVNTTAINVLINGTLSVLKTENNECPLVNQFLKSNDGYIYATSDDGLFRMSGNRFERLPVKGSSPANDPAPCFGTIIEYKDYLLFATNDLRNLIGLYIYNKKTQKLTDRINDKVIIFLGKDKKEEIWVSYPDKLYKLDPDALSQGLLKPVPASLPGSATANYPVNIMSFTGENTLLVTRDNKIIAFNETGVTLEMPSPEQAVSSVARNILIDRENSAWICYDGAAVFKLTSPRFHILKNLFVHSPSPTIIRAANTGSNTWFTSTSSNVLLKKNSSGVNSFTSNISPAPYIFYEDAGKLWAYDIKNMYEAPLDNSFRITFTKTISLNDSNVFGKTVMVDPFRNIIGTTRDGLMVWKNNQPVFRYSTNGADLVEGLSFDKEGRMWLVSRYTDILAFNLHPEDPSHYLQVTLRIKNQSSTFSPRSMIIDKKGRMWIGTRYDGVIVYQINKDGLRQVANLRTGNGLTDNFVTSLTCDENNNIIAGTQTGLDRIIAGNDGQYRVENLTKSGNFYTYVREVWTEPRNKVFALTNTGTVIEVLAPDLATEKTHPEVLLEEIKINGHPGSLSKNSFHYNENNISFTLAAPSFIDEEQIRFSWLLEGATRSAWSDTSSANSTINLTNIPDGNYTLRIKAFFPSTSYPPAESVYSFEIKAPWWQTWWFRLLLAIALVSLLILGVRIYYSRKLEKQRRLLEKQQAIEKERTRIATDMHDDLGAGLSRIKFLSETIGIKKQQEQPIEEDISKIREYSHEMIDKMGEIVWALNEKNDSLDDLLSYTRSYAVEYLSQNGITSKTEMDENTPDLFVSGEFRRNIYLTVKEALHNIVKHAQAGMVNIHMSAGVHLKISIKDDGAGFDPDNIRPFSNGLHNMEKRMLEIGGSLEIKHDSGTTVVLIAPLK